MSKRIFSRYFLIHFKIQQNSKSGKPYAHSSQKVGQRPHLNKLLVTVLNPINLVHAFLLQLFNNQFISALHLRRGLQTDFVLQVFQRIVWTFE
jgi:hypothetical protein